MADRRRHIPSLMIATVVVAMLAACAGAPATEDPEGDPVAASLTLEEAKKITLDRTAEIIAQFPTENVAESSVTETSRSLYDCAGDDDFSWPAVARVIITGDPDRADVIDAIEAEWSGRDGWSVTRSTNRKNELPQLDLVHVDGSRFAVGYFDGGAEFSVSAASPCFHLEGGRERGAEY